MNDSNPYVEVDIDQYAQDIDLNGSFLNFSPSDTTDTRVAESDNGNQILVSEGPYRGGAKQEIVDIVEANTPSSGPAFLSIALVAFGDTIYPGDVTDAITDLKNNSKSPYEFVQADEYFALARQELLWSLAQYANSNGVIDKPGLNDAVSDWESDDISTEFMLQVSKKWRTGEDVTNS